MDIKKSKWGSAFLTVGFSQKNMHNRNYQFGIREKLIFIFILIKVIPLVLLALLAANQVGKLGGTVKEEYSEIIRDTHGLVSQVGDLATENSISALDTKSREAIERLSTDTAAAVASFLYQRDDDVEFVANLKPDIDVYKEFLKNKKRAVIQHRPWSLNAQQSGWEPRDPELWSGGNSVKPEVKDNEKEFHYREPAIQGITEERPLYLEITFFDLKGQEKIKVTTSDLLSKELRDISKKENTWCKAETYFAELGKLADSGIYVSEVIGPYLPSPLIGPYTPQSARKAGVLFEPEKAGYAGKENPVGRRFRGIIRWVKPVLESGRRIGYVSLALDHTHVMEFTDHIVPTEKRYSAISDASTGNYAFMWDYKGRNISHPRDYFIVGYNPETGEPSVPWLSSEVYQQWKKSGLKYADFEKTAPWYDNQSLKKKPAKELIKSGNLGLDCRYLNFAPQCSGWKNLTRYGGSGSFVIFWSKLWKLTTAATIPYYTGRYGQSPRGFGYVTIGANVHEFHSAANETAKQILGLKTEYEKSLKEKERNTLSSMTDLLAKTQKNLTISTLIMVIAVMFIAVWMASTLTQKILEMIRGIHLFRDGNFQHRLSVKSDDEMGQLAIALNEMSDKIQDSMTQIDEARKKAEESEKTKSQFLTNMSHEIRTPLNAIIGMSRLSLDSAEGEEQHLLQTINDSATSLLSLLNDILDFSKVEAGQLELEIHNFDLHSCLRQAIDTIEIQSKQQGLDFSFTIGGTVPRFVKGDGLRLKQVLMNILSNAVKFTKEGRINMVVDVVEITSKNTRLRVAVEDTGIGIPEGMEDEIFKGFSQVDKTITREFQGAGLGLALTRKLCQLMGGDVNIDHTCAHGSTVVFTILLESAEDEYPLRQESERGLKGKRRFRVLLVEDNSANRDLARMILENDGHEVVEATNGLEALAKLAEEPIDSILMDIQMPKMDGLETTRIIRAVEKGLEPEKKLENTTLVCLKNRLVGKHHPIIALTAHSMSGDREKCMAAGIDRYLTKPFVSDHVLAVLQEL